MKVIFSKWAAVLILAGMTIAQPFSLATEYFLAVNGDDNNSGLSQTTAFATLQRGIDALQPGDTLTILPGEYFGSARSVGLGDATSTTRIRALIQGTVAIHGDLPSPEFTKLDGYRFVYATPYSAPVHGVNEWDSLRVLKETVSVGDVDVRPGSFFHDTEANMLYISPSGFESATGRHFSICSIANHGLYLREPRNVTIEGISFRGFQKLGESEGSDQAGNATWGLFISNGYRCVIQHCSAYFNNRGIGINSTGTANDAVAAEAETGYNVIQYCSAWANHTIYGYGGGAINVFSPNRDQIRQSQAFLNGGLGIFMYLGKNYGLIYQNLAWGNNSDFGLKADRSITSLLNVGPGMWSSDASARRVIHSLVGSVSSTGEQFSDNIILHDQSAIRERPLYRDLNPEDEFADPFNKDYRLQASSRFRGAAEDGSDLGPFQFTPTVHFVSPDGNDEADGLSTGSAWKTLTHAATQLKAGHTLYMLPGEYDEDLNLSGITSTWREPLTVRTRGAGAVVIHGAVSLQNCSHVTLSNLDFRSTVTASASEQVIVTQSRFIQEGTLHFEAVNAPRVIHNDFELDRGPAVVINGGRDAFISGNNFSHSTGVALAVQHSDSVVYANYNTYPVGHPAWQVGADVYHADATPNQWETASITAPPTVSPGFGLYGRPVGTYPADPDAVTIESKPELLVATATTANLEWYAASPAFFTVAWGTTPDTPNKANVYGESFFTFSLTNLEPETSYYFRLISAQSTPSDAEDSTTATFPINSEPLRFETAASDRPAQIFYIATDGDNAATGTSPDQPWATFFHAMTQLRPGDTLMVLEGQYSETVRVRTSGTEKAPVTIRSAPGATVIFDSKGRIPNYFIVDYKDFIHIDGFYTFSVSPNFNNRMFASGAIRARGAANLTVSRVMMDGRMIYYSGPLITAYQCPNLLIENCVQIDNLTVSSIIDCPDARVANCVFLRSKIFPLKILNRPNDRATIENSIFTDSLARKGNSLLISVGYYPMLRTFNNAYFFRRPLDQRPLMGLYGQVAYERSTAAYDMHPRDNDPPHPITDQTVVRSTPIDWHTNRFTDGDFIDGDPVFAIVVANAKAEAEMREHARITRPEWQSFDWIASGPLRHTRLSFADFIATQPQFLQRNIGLQPEAFEGFGKPQ